jgi:hypothetical protein
MPVDTSSPDNSDLTERRSAGTYQEKLSITTHRNEVARHQKAPADLQKKIANESKKEAEKVKSLNHPYFPNIPIQESSHL